ncbi:uncharacterized protein ARMOST_16466 [Armillaria ostoyae]|uniref:Uncharacterized protein n=1 Tax=Armillaria ostoyae TaxID=47428 RepID=A0A284RW91_ARMOS|nr:uncharacterized protein ARMOST_16466 [Armillaria ostoyae]
MALDLFTITCIPVIAIEDYDVLSTLTFNDNSTFSAEETVVTAIVASDAADEYNIFTSVTGEGKTDAKGRSTSTRRRSRCRKGKTRKLETQRSEEGERRETLEARRREEAALQREVQHGWVACTVPS